MRLAGDLPAWALCGTDQHHVSPPKTFQLFLLVLSEGHPGLGLGWDHGFCFVLFCFVNLFSLFIFGCVGSSLLRTGFL